MIEVVRPRQDHLIARLGDAHQREAEGLVAARGDADLARGDRRAAQPLDTRNLDAWCAQFGGDGSIERASVTARISGSSEPASSAALPSTTMKYVAPASASKVRRVPSPH